MESLCTWTACQWKKGISLAPLPISGPQEKALLSENPLDSSPITKHFMKVLSLFSFVLPMAITAPAQDKLPIDIGELTISERGLHHRVWQRVTPYVTSYQKSYLRTNSYVVIPCLRCGLGTVVEQRSDSRRWWVEPVFIRKQ